jgi:hypothetical protein
MAQESKESSPINWDTDIPAALRAVWPKIDVATDTIIPAFPPVPALKPSESGPGTTNVSKQFQLFIWLQPLKASDTIQDKNLKITEYAVERLLNLEFDEERVRFRAVPGVPGPYDGNTPWPQIHRENSRFHFLFEVTLYEAGPFMTRKQQEDMNVTPLTGKFQESHTAEFFEEKLERVLSGTFPCVNADWRHTMCMKHAVTLPPRSRTRVNATLFHANAMRLRNWQEALQAGIKMEVHTQNWPLLQFARHDTLANLEKDMAVREDEARAQGNSPPAPSWVEALVKFQCSRGNEACIGDWLWLMNLTYTDGTTLVNGSEEPFTMEWSTLTYDVLTRKTLQNLAWEDTSILHCTVVNMMKTGQRYAAIHCNMQSYQLKFYDLRPTCPRSPSAQEWLNSRIIPMPLLKALKTADTAQRVRWAKQVLHHIMTLKA